MKWIIDLKKKRAMKKANLVQVLRLVKLPTEKTPVITFELLSNEYQMKWYKRRISRLAKNFGIKEEFSKKNDSVTFVCRDYAQAIMLGGCMDQDTRRKLFQEIFKIKI